jgi:MOSC domain-containing protein
MSNEAIAGSVLSVLRYPVKSMMGEELTVADVTESGLIGDRAYALIDNATGKIASAKNPRKWARLFDCHASFVEPPRKGHPVPPVWIMLPDGSNITSDQPNANAVLSRFFEREVTLAKTAPESPALEEYWPDVDGLAHRETVTEESIALSSPKGSFFDYAVAHVITTNTLNRLRELYPQGRFEARRFRPNVIVAVGKSEPDFVENAWVGLSVEMGQSLVLKVSNPCPRCVMTTLPQADLPQDHGILRTVAQHNQPFVPALGTAMPSVGVYANVLRSGTVRRSDPVRTQQALAAA